MILLVKLSYSKGHIEMHKRNPVMALAFSSALALSVSGCGDRQANEFLFVALGSVGGAVLGSQIGDGSGRTVIQEQLLQRNRVQ